MRMPIRAYVASNSALASCRRRMLRQRPHSLLSLGCGLVSLEDIPIQLFTMVSTHERSNEAVGHSVSLSLFKCIIALHVCR